MSKADYYRNMELPSKNIFVEDPLFNLDIPPNFEEQEYNTVVQQQQINLKEISRDDSSESEHEEEGEESEIDQDSSESEYDDINYVSPNKSKQEAKLIIHDSIAEQLDNTSFEKVTVDGLGAVLKKDITINDIDISIIILSNDKNKNCKLKIFDSLLKFLELPSVISKYSGIKKIIIKPIKDESDAKGSKRVSNYGLSIFINQKQVSEFEDLFYLGKHSILQPTKNSDCFIAIASISTLSNIFQSMIHKVESATKGSGRVIPNDAIKIDELPEKNASIDCATIENIKSNLRTTIIYNNLSFCINLFKSKNLSQSFLESLVDLLNIEWVNNKNKKTIVIKNNPQSVKEVQFFIRFDSESEFSVFRNATRYYYYEIADKTLTALVKKTNMQQMVVFLRRLVMTIKKTMLDLDTEKVIEFDLDTVNAKELFESRYKKQKVGNTIVNVSACYQENKIIQTIIEMLRSKLIREELNIDEITLIRDFQDKEAYTVYHLSMKVFNPENFQKLYNRLFQATTSETTLVILDDSTFQMRGTVGLLSKKLNNLFIQKHNNRRIAVDSDSVNSNSSSKDEKILEQPKKQKVESLSSNKKVIKEQLPVENSRQYNTRSSVQSTSLNMEAPQSSLQENSWRMSEDLRRVTRNKKINYKE